MFISNEQEERVILRSEATKDLKPRRSCNLEILRRFAPQDDVPGARLKPRCSISYLLQGIKSALQRGRQIALIFPNDRCALAEACSWSTVPLFVTRRLDC